MKKSKTFPFFVVLIGFLVFAVIVNIPSIVNLKEAFKILVLIGAIGFFIFLYKLLNKRR